MSVLRRILGVFVMLAGIVGLLLSLAGLVGLWMLRPVIVTSIDSTIATLSSSVDTSNKAMVITGEALGATVNSVDALSDMLHTTALTVDDTQPVITQVNGVMGETLPASFKAAQDSLKASQEAAASLESAIKSFETFQMVMGATPFLSAFVPASTTSYNPETSLAESLGALSVSIEEMPATFEEMSANMDKADDNLELIKTNLNTMSTSVGLISSSLSQYQSMIGESRASMENLKVMLAGIQSNLPQIMNITSIVLGLFFLWLLAAQAVIFSQGLELYRGTAGRMEGGAPVPAAPEAVSAD